jgi:hypothetical protein
MNAGEKQVPTPPLSSKKSLANSAADPVPATAVRDQLARVVNSPSFVSSVRLCRFLTHIVNRTIDGDIDSLKEFSIAMEVFDRTPKYDPNIDAIVRVEARRLRADQSWRYEPERSHAWSHRRKECGTVRSPENTLVVSPDISQCAKTVSPLKQLADRLTR